MRNILLIVIAASLGSCDKGPTDRPSSFPTQIEANERNAKSCLKMVVTAEENLRFRDLDGNETRDYWVADLRGLYFMKRTEDGKPIAALDDRTIAEADASPALGAPFKGAGAEYDSAAAGAGHPQSKSGYFFKAVKVDGTRGCMNPGRYAFCAYPAAPGKSGAKTFYVDNVGTVWWKDLGGAPVDRALTDDDLKSWKKTD